MHSDRSRNADISSPNPSGGTWAKIVHSLRFRLLLALNLAILGSLGIFLVWGYFADWSRILQEKRSALEHQARALLPMVQRRTAAPEEIQEYIEDLSRSMAKNNVAGRIIVIHSGGQLFYAGPNAGQRREMYRAMQKAVGHEEGKAQGPGGQVVAAEASASGTQVFVGEYRSNLNVTPRTAIMRQVFLTLRLAVILTAVVTFLSHRMVIRKIAALTDVVRRVRAGELGAQVEEPMPSELSLLSDTMNDMSSRLAQLDQERIQAMEKARRIEERLHPSAGEASDLPVAWSYRPAAEVAGDFFDIHRDGDTVVFVVADVTGHGVSAALGAAMLKVLWEDAVSETEDPGMVLAMINKRFMEISLEEDFCSMAVATFHRETGKLRYASAGHEPAFLLRNSRVRRTLDSTGPVLGVVPEGAWETTEQEVTAEDILFLYTDGLTEAHSPDGEPLGRERLIDWLAEIPAEDVDSLIHELLRKTDDFRSSKKQEDDITLLATRM